MMSRNKRIILSFDDGPHPQWTDQLLNVLAKYDVKATFFLVGKKVKQYPNMVEKIIRHQHLIGNHTWSHRLLLGTNRNTLKKEIFEYDQFFKKTFNYSMKLFRPPWGILSKKSAQIIEKQYGYEIFYWNKDSYDYILPCSRKMFKSILNTKLDPVIVLFHDGIIMSPVFTRKYSLRTIENLLQLKNTGHRFILPV